MKNKSIVLLALSGLLVFSAFKIADDIIARLAFTHKEAQQYILTNFTGVEDPDGGNSSGMMMIPYTKMLPAIIIGDKTGAAKELCQYVKDFVNSEEFLVQYAASKEAALPLNEGGATISSLKKDMVIIQKNIDNYKTDLKYVAEQEKEKANAQGKLDKLLEAAKKPFPEKAAWEQAYPNNPAVLVKRRLEEYLKVAATVDFAATTTAPDRYKIRKFINPVYEKKSQQWKAIYRAGKEVNDVVTAFVKEWLKGDIIAAAKVKMPSDETEKKAENTNSGNTPSTNTSNTTTTTTNSTNTSTTTTETKPAATVPEVKEKKGFFKKLKEKSKAVINY